ncbi:MAG: hypothetical protein K1W22_02090 [Lachnospiraceae bacterium]
MKRISLEALLYARQDAAYRRQYEYILALISEGKIRPLKASGTNGKHPALYREYWLAEPGKDYRILEEELKYQLHPMIVVDYYLSHLASYEKDRQWVLMLSEYLKEKREKLEYTESTNERSFEIWNHEKFLSRGQGKRILKNCGLEEGFLNIYQTTEPLAYYSRTRQVPQNILILENKDTFYSMRRHIMSDAAPEERDSVWGKGNGRDCGEAEVVKDKACGEKISLRNRKGSILGVEIGTLIYGAGKGILRSFLDFDLCVEPYMKDGRNRIYYFGDLDYEGIGIYESLAEMGRGRWEILPFTKAYEAMLEKADGTCGAKNLPDTKEQQNRNIREDFFSFFHGEIVSRMKAVLEAGKYIPQEILNIADF